MIGRDSSGEKLLSALKKLGISTNYVISDDVRPTILKSRIIAASQHVVRVDREDKSVLSPALTQLIVKRLRELIPRVDAVIISDYEKGLVTKTICQAAVKFARANKKPIAVDPKGSDYGKYAGSTIITPNLREAIVASGIDINSDASLLAAGKIILQKAKSRYALITRGRDGMTLLDNKEAKTFPAVPREVFDITGAGDAVIATLTLALSAGASLKEATLLSNFAGSVVVGKIGTAPCFREELEEALAGHEPITKKIKTRQEIGPIAGNLKNEGVKVVFTNGCFDILHLGHVRYLREAKKLGDVLIVGVNSDKSVAALKGPSRPYVSEMERAEILASLEFVDYVIIFSELRPDNLIKAVAPNVHVKGGDYKIDDLPEKKIVESLGGKVVVIPPIKGRSTTNIVAKILGGKK